MISLVLLLLAPPALDLWDSLGSRPDIGVARTRSARVDDGAWGVMSSSIRKHLSSADLPFHDAETGARTSGRFVSLGVWNRAARVQAATEGVSLVLVVTHATCRQTKPKKERYQRASDPTGSKVKATIRGAEVSFRAELVALSGGKEEVLSSWNAATSSGAPLSMTVSPGQRQVSRINEPEPLLESLASTMPRHATTAYTAAMLWQARDELPQRLGELSDEEARAFWRLALDLGRAQDLPLPWHTLQKEALAEWDRARSLAATGELTDTRRTATRWALEYLQTSADLLDHTRTPLPLSRVLAGDGGDGLRDPVAYATCERFVQEWPDDLRSALEAILVKRFRRPRRPGPRRELVQTVTVRPGPTRTLADVMAGYDPDLGPSPFLVLVPQPGDSITATHSFTERRLGKDSVPRTRKRLRDKRVNGTSISEMLHAATRFNLGLKDSR